MVNDEQTVTDKLPEPADGTTLAVFDGDEWKVIWRDDAAADRWYDGDARGQNWLASDDEDPMGFYQHVKYAKKVYVIGEPVAVFR